VARRSRTSHVVNLIHFEKYRQGDVMPDQLKIGTRQQVNDVGFLCGEEIIEANYVVPIIHKAFAHVRTQKTRSTSHKNAFDFRHKFTNVGVIGTK
jgi:hypothetical protein